MNRPAGLRMRAVDGSFDGHAAAEARAFDEEEGSRSGARLRDSIRSPGNDPRDRRLGGVPANGSGPGVVLHVVRYFGGGGSEQRIVDLIRALEGYEHVLVVGQMVAVERLERLDVRIIEVPHLVRRIAPVSDARATIAVRRLIREMRPALVVTHQSKGGVVGRVACGLARTEARVAHSLSMSALDEAPNRISRNAYRAIERALVPLTDVWLCVGEDLAAQYERFVGVPRDRIHIVRSSLDLTRFMPEDQTSARHQLGLPDQPTFLYVGAFEERKGVLALADIFAHLRNSLGPCSAVLVGSGSRHGEVVKAISGLDGVTVLAPGHVSDVHVYMHASDALCLPSRAEGLPQVLVQAAAVGLPFVVYEGTCGVTELIAMGADGVTVARGHRAAIASALEAAYRRSARQPVAARSAFSDWDAHQVMHRYRAVLS